MEDQKDMQQEATSNRTREWFIVGPVVCPSAVLQILERMGAGTIKRLRPKFRDEDTGEKVPVVITGMKMGGSVEGEFCVAFTGTVNGEPVAGNFEPERGRGYVCLA